MQQFEATWGPDVRPFIDHGRLEKAVVNALMKAGRDGIRSVRTASARTIRFRKRIKLRTVNESMHVGFPHSRSLADLAWRLDVDGEAIPVSEYNPRQTAEGVTVAINIGPRKLIKSAFLATMKSGHFGVWIRTTKKPFPIQELYTTRVTDVFHDAGMIPAVFKVGMRAFDATFTRVLPLELARLK